MSSMVDAGMTVSLLFRRKGRIREQNPFVTVYIENMLFPWYYLFSLSSQDKFS